MTKPVSTRTRSKRRSLDGSLVRVEHELDTALAHRANKIAFALVRDQATYDQTRWT